MPYIIVLSGGVPGLHGKDLYKNISASAAVGDKAESGGGSLVSTSGLNKFLNGGSIITFDETEKGVSPIIDGVQMSLSTSTQGGSNTDQEYRVMYV